MVIMTLLLLAQQYGTSILEKPTVLLSMTLSSITEV